MNTVLGVLLNHAADLDRFGAAAHQAPYQAPPRHPVLHVRPRSTWAASGADVQLPRDAQSLRVEASLAAVIGRCASGVRAEDALGHVAGWLLVADLCLPHDSLYRPALRQRVRDGFCVMASEATPRAAVADPDALALEIAIDGGAAQRTSTSGRVRPMARLIADISDFMTLQPGDVVMLGPAPDAPRVCAGQRVQIAAPGLPPVSFAVVAS